MLSRVAFVGLAVVLWARPIGAGSGTGSDSADTFVNSFVPNNNMGASHGMHIGAPGQGGVTRGLIRFTLPNGLTGRVTVTSTTVTVTVEGINNTQSSGGTAATYSLWRLTQNWAEGNSANDVATGFSMGAACGSVFGATWNQATCSTTNWSTAGGTNAGVISAQANSAAVINSAVTFSSGACAGTNLSCDVQNWIDNGNAFGWLITSSSVTVGQAQRFYTKEAGANAPTLAFTFSCKAGYKDIGSTCTTCTDAANADCITSHVGNTCNDAGPPSTTYACSCDPAVYKSGTGSDGKPACVIGCSPTNHCRDGGDPSAACTDTATGYTCGCSSGFVLNAAGTSCVSACPGPPDPCGAGTCAVAAGGWTCGCNTGYVSTGGQFPTCTDYNACTAAASSDCTTFAGNFCVDNAAPSTTYHCTCGNPAFVAGTGTDGQPACVDLDECMPNHCRDAGDTAAACADHVAPATGYDCTCSSALWTSVGGTCVDVDECASGNPCAHGTCANVGAGGGYTCACDAGYVSSGGMQPTCTELDACDAAAIAACTTETGNACVDEAAPSTGYHCTCANAAYTDGSVGGKPACVDRDECAPNHCRDGGDATAACADHAAPASGYDCTCDAGYASDGVTCNDIDECAGNPCGNGTCSNVPGSYECTCDAGYETTLDAAPTCMPKAAADTGCGCGSSRGGDAAPIVLFVAIALRRRRRR